MKSIDKYEFIELVIPANFTGTRVTFADQPQLRFVSQAGLEWYNAATLTNSILSGNANISQAKSLTGFLVLYYADKESAKYIPLNLLNPVANSQASTTVGYNSVFGVKTFQGQQVQWSKSYVQFTAAPGETFATSICFGVYYS